MSICRAIIGFPGADNGIISITWGVPIADVIVICLAFYVGVLPLLVVTSADYVQVSDSLVPTSALLLVCVDYEASVRYSALCVDEILPWPASPDLQRSTDRTVTP